MKISEFIRHLQGIQKTHGDLPIVGGCMSDDVPPGEPSVLTEDGCDLKFTQGGKAHGVFFE